MTKKKDNTKVIIWIMIAILVILILNGNIDLTNLFSVVNNPPEGSPEMVFGGMK